MNQLTAIKRQIEHRRASERATDRTIYRIENLPRQLDSARARLAKYERRAVDMDGPLSALPRQIDLAKARIAQLEDEARRLGMAYLVEGTGR